MISKRYQLGIVMLIAIVPILLLPFLSLTGFDVYTISETGWLMTSSISGMYAFNITTFYANVTNADDPNINCTYRYNLVDSAMSEEYNMTKISLYKWEANATINISGVYAYNITCIDSDNDRANKSNEAFTLMNNSALSYNFTGLNLTWINNSLNASYNDIYGSHIPNANCTVNYSEGIVNMTDIGSIYSANFTFYSSGIKPLILNCTKENYSTQTYSFTVNVSKFFDVAYNWSSTTGVSYSSLAWADVNNDDWWDLVYSGQGVSYVKTCNNNYTTISCTDSNIPASSYGSINFGDIYKDGALDMIITGKNSSQSNDNNYFKYYRYIGTVFSVSQTFSGIRYSSSALIDINHDGFLDLLSVGTTGTDSSNAVSSVYSGNTTNFTSLSSSLENINLGSISYLYLINGSPSVILSGATSVDDPFSSVYQYNNGFSLLQGTENMLYASSAVADFDNNKITDFILTGLIDLFEEDNPLFCRNIIYNGSFSGFIRTKNLTNASKASMSVGDYNNDGLIDLVVIDSNNAIFYKNNGSGLVNDGSMSLPKFSQGSIAFFDYDNDGDLDLAISGGGNAVVYNNQYSLIRPNLPPSPPTSFNSSFDGTWLNLTWNNGSDTTTPLNGLYYNLRVGTTPYSNDVISGKYGGSSNPTQGYLGNMMELHSYGVNVSSNKTYFFQVQTIDAGLRQSNWSSLQVYDPCNYTSGDWNIRVQCVRFNETINVAGNINISAGSLVMLNSTLILNGNLYLTNGTLNITNSAVTLASNNIIIYNNTYLNIGYSNISSFSYFEINSSNITFYNNNIYSSSSGVILYSENSELRDSNISTTVTNYGSNNSLLNITNAALSSPAGNLNVKWHVTFNVTNSSIPLADTTISAVNSTASLISSLTTSSLGIATLNLTEYSLSQAGNSYYTNYTVTFAKSLYTTYSYTLNFTSNANLTISLNLSATPNFDNFNLCTNFSDNTTYPDLNNVPSAYIGINNSGLINFTQNISVSSVNLTRLINISHNRIYINESVPGFSGVNKSAILTIYNLSYSTLPIVLKNSLVCTDCNISLYDGQNLTFNVSGFSEYITTTSSKLEISRTLGKLIPTQRVYFYANYTNYSSGLPILDANCTFNFTNNMTYNETLKLYYYNRTFDDLLVRSYTVNYTISCNDTLLLYENLTLNSSINIEVNQTLLSENASLEGMDEGASIVVSDVNNDNYYDLIISGYNYSAYSSSIFYYNLGYSNSNVSRLISYMYGSMGLVDYNKDNAREIIILGYNGAAGKKILTSNLLDDSNISISSLMLSSQSWSDYDLDGNLDVALCGESSSNNNRTLIYSIISNSSGTITQNRSFSIINVTQCSLNWADLDNDGYNDLIVAGNSNEGPILKVYKNSQGSSFANTQSLTGIAFADVVVGDINNDNYLDLVAIGCLDLIDTTHCNNPNVSVYINNQGTLQFNSSFTNNLTNVWHGSLALADYNNDGYLDLALSGTITNLSSGAITYLYKNNGINFTLDQYNILDGIYWGSLAFEDFDNDSDVDLFISGMSSSRITKVFKNDQDFYNPNAAPSYPSDLYGYFNNSKIILNWSNGSDEETPTLGLYYNLRAGSTPYSNNIISGLYAKSSNPTQGYFGNMMQHHSYNFTYQERCVFWQVQTIDSGMKASNWSALKNVSFTEICDGYDNDCDQLIDEICDVDGDGYLNWSLSCVDNFRDINGTLKSCASDYASDCNDNNSSIYFHASEICGNGIDEDCNNADSSCVVNPGGGGGGTTTAARTVAVNPPQQKEETKKIVTPPSNPPSKESPSSGSSKSLEENVLDQLLANSFKLTRTFEIANGRTKITDRIKNLDLFDRNVNIHTSLPKSLASNADEIVKITPYSVIQYDPVIGFNTSIPSFKEAYFHYALNKQLTEADVAEIISQIIENSTEKEALKQELQKKINETNKYINITQSFTTDFANNKTIITLDININDSATLYNVSIFQEIPKCLLEIINEQMVEATNKKFEIINADPLIVWHFDNILDAKQIQLSINAIADENCTNQIKALAVAKDIVLLKKSKEINYLNLWLAVSIVPVLALILILFGIFCTKVEHEDEEVRKLTEIVRKYYSHGLTAEQIKSKLQQNYPAWMIDDCLKLHTQSKFHFWIHRFEIGFEELILIVLILFNIAEFIEILPGDLNYLQKIMSIVLMAYLMYKVSVTDLLFGKRIKSIDIMLIVIFTSLTLKNIVNLARSSWQEADFVLDLYSYIIAHNAVFETYIFLGSIVLLLLISLYLAFTLEIKAPSLITALHIKEGKSKSIFGIILRFIVMHFLLLIFFVVIFNLMMEWLAVVIDSFITTLILVIMVVLIIKHWKKFSFGKFLEETSEASESFYEKFVSLFHYKKTIYLGVSGMLILHILTEIGNFIVPYFLGLRIGKSDLYFGFMSSGHMPLFSIHGDSLFNLQTVGFGLSTKIGVIFVYAMNMLALLFLAAIPALVWLHFFRNKDLPILTMPRFKFTPSKLLNALLFCLFVASIIVFIAKPVFTLSSIYATESSAGTYKYNLAGVDILTHEISLDGISSLALICLAAIVISFLLSYFFESIVNYLFFPVSFVFFGIYTYTFTKSTLYYNMIYFDTLLNANEALAAVYTLLLGLISFVILYLLGFCIITYLYSPLVVKTLLTKMPIIGEHFKSHHLHFIHHHDEHDNLDHGSKEQVLKDYILNNLDAGHELFYIVECLIEQKWHIDIIEKAINLAEHDKLYAEEVKHVLHYHHNMDKINQLANWIYKVYPDHSLKDIFKIAASRSWTEDDLMIAFKTIKGKLKLRPEDSEVMKYLA